MIRSDKIDDCYEKLNKLEEEHLLLEIENHSLQQTIKSFEFDLYKLQEIQRLANAGGWELNHLTYKLEISAELSLVLSGEIFHIVDISWHDFLEMMSAPGQQDIKKKLLENVIKNGESLVFEHTLSTPDDRTFFVRQHCKTFYNTIGQPLITVGLIQDISNEHSQSVKLEKFAAIDELTQLYNRRRINEILQEQHALFQRYRKTCSCIMIDIDFFKLFNDKYGHQIGDEVLRQVAKTIKNNTRSVDYAGRWGGEEFMLVCHDTLLTRAGVLAEKLRKTFMEIKIPNVHVITASFGVGELANGEDIDSFVKRIDDALYEAKENGRNQVSFAYPDSAS